MLNKASLLHLVTRAERGALLPGEAQLLRDAIESLADMTDTVNALCGCQGLPGPAPDHHPGEPANGAHVVATGAPEWPECMCTDAGECGRCWERRQ